MVLSRNELETLPAVVSEHADEAPFLWLQRCGAIDAPNYSSRQLGDLDERLEAHIDGLRVAGEEGWKLAEAARDNESTEDFFPASVLAIEAADDRFSTILERAEELPTVAPAVISALGWVDPKFLKGRVKSLLAGSPFQQMVGVAACAVHRRDPGVVLDSFIASPAPNVRARALRTAGQLGRTDLLPIVTAALKDSKRDARFWATWSAVLLGDRRRALDALVGYALKPGVRQFQSLKLALQAMDMERGHELLLQCAELPDSDRLRIIGSGFVGSVRYVPWLIEQMANPPLARVAGEAFVNITGADFNLDQLEAMPPDGCEDGPTEDPVDENVDVPEDIALPWPDLPRVKSWWERNGSRFTSSSRYFLGAPVGHESCSLALRTGFQRQRVSAAHYLSLLSPGTPLFNTSAPAWRQEQWLAQ